MVRGFLFLEALRLQDGGVARTVLLTREAEVDAALFREWIDLSLPNLLQIGRGLCLSAYGLQDS